MTRKWRGTAPPGGVRARASEAMREEYVVAGTAGSRSRARGNVGESLLPPLVLGLNVMLASRHFLRPLPLLFSTGDHANSNFRPGEPGFGSAFALPINRVTTLGVAELNMRSFFRSTNLLRWTLNLLLMPAATASAINSDRIDQKHLPAWTNTAAEFSRTKVELEISDASNRQGFVSLASNPDNPWPKTSGQGCPDTMQKS